MLSFFKYKSFEPSSEVKAFAETSLSQIVKLSAEGAVIVARAEFDGTEYGCSIDIFQRYGSQYVFVTDSDVMQAIERAVSEMKHKLLSPNDLTAEIYKRITERKTRVTHYQ